MKKTLSISIVLNILLLAFIAYSSYQNKMDVDKIKQKARLTTLREIFTNYHKAKKSIFEVMPNDSNEIIFVGNSITDYCDWNELLGNANIKNRGISADVISGVVDRLDEITESKPKKIFLMIGINDLQRKRSVNQILADYENLILLIKEKTPQTNLYIQSLLPTKRDNLSNSDVMEINTGLILLSQKFNLIYINLFDLFKTENNQMNMDYSFEGLHPNGKGYLVWKTAIDNYVNEPLK